MKTRIIVSSIFVLLITSFIVFNTNQDVSASPEDNSSVTDKPLFLAALTGSGSSLTNSSVRARNVSTEADYYGEYDTEGVYFIYGMPAGYYNVYVCTNYPSRDVVYNIYFDGVYNYHIFSLSGGQCIYPD